jgi:hypothetical protein
MVTGGADGSVEVVVVVCGGAVLVVVTAVLAEKPRMVDAVAESRRRMLGVGPSVAHMYFGRHRTVLVIRCPHD